MKNNLLIGAIVIFTLLAPDVRGQKAEGLSLKVLLDSLAVSQKEPLTELTLSVVNGDNFDFVLYGAKGLMRYIPVSPSYLCDINNTGLGGMVVVIYGDQGMQKFITTSSHDSTKQTSSNRVHLTKQSDYFTTALVLRAQEQVQLATSVDLTDFKLQRGIYSLQVIYYSGKKRSIITEDQVKQDLVKHKAKLFQGCLISNPVKLIVK